ncbi:cellulase family glycosylhydrolase [Flammeovirga yaeyamensis]|uniref:Cellulase family glycosylhydrolase n=1 Tax=Flammeovirga yaeyamensis TaxID=367791 RepID=A0AAX1N0Y6_9BACT|nr:glycoside hydrolase family 5 protein [Flammeovirga yaeyamensis]MBB3698614.1 aryl-phospho-beta-D-glucosidase BglC (GH1 family) [Flammeovirga yaeyamensis]NMF34038.1 glycoside hydrolase family 5 protein [Flammeovirga yaeyamensis]QWG01026.1 cellulase family glycosylhydrolase [Flammeovirga yaeyamensis]
MKQFNLILSFRILNVLLILFSFQLKAQVSSHGLLQVEGNKIINQNGENISFAGASLFWSNNGWGGAKYYTKEVVSWLNKDWDARIIRAAMGIEDKGGYFTDEKSNKERVELIINAAVENDMYVIIDWHSHHAHETDWDKAASFFEEMAKKYGHLPNVLYEIYNEPLQVSWSKDIKPYAESIISAIRKHDPDNIIIVGTPTWSQDVDDAAKDPIDQSNIAYTLHFYAGSHGQKLRNKADEALKKGIALFVTEWGAVNANGDGKVDYEETNAWIKWMKQNNISHCNWSINDKAEGASALLPGASNKGGWKELTPSGTFVRKIMLEYNTIEK